MQEYHHFCIYKFLLNQKELNAQCSYNETEYWFKKKKQNDSWGLYQRIEGEEINIFLSIGGKSSEKQTEQEVMMAKIDEVSIAQICAKEE